jgi:hypothetical protein
MISIGIGVPNHRYSGISFTTEYQAILDRATALGYTKPSAAQQLEQNQLIIDLKAAGIWDDCDVIRIAANDGSAAFGTLNWKNPSTFQATLINSPSFVSNGGYLGNGTTSYINENFAPSDGTNYSLNDASEFIWINDALSTSGFIYGASDAAGTNASTCERNATTQVYPRINSSSGIFYDNAVNAQRGLFGSHRNSATSASYSKNGSVVITSPLNSTTRTANKSYSLCRNLNGSASNFIPNTYSIKIFAKNILTTKLSTLYTLLNTYMS